MAEHLHGYPQCETPAGQPCGPGDLNYAECQAYGPIESCSQSVVDGIPTSQYHCVHRDAQTAARPKAKAKPKKAAKKAKAKPKKAARKAAKKAGKKAAKKAKGKAKKAGKKKKKK